MKISGVAAVLLLASALLSATAVRTPDGTGDKAHDVRADFLEYLAMIGPDRRFDPEVDLSAPALRAFHRLSEDNAIASVLARYQPGHELPPTIEDIFLIASQQRGRQGLALLYLSAMEGVERPMDGTRRAARRHQPGLAAIVGLFCVDYAAFRVATTDLEKRSLVFDQCVTSFVMLSPTRGMTTRGRMILSDLESAERVLVAKAILEAFESFLSKRGDD